MPETTPTCLGILLCDQIIEDKRTNKKSLIGTFNDILVSGTPCNHPCMFLLVTLTNCRHEQDIQIEIAYDTADGVKDVLRMQGKVPQHNPLHIIDLVFELHGVPIPDVGTYSIDVTTLPEGRRIVQRSFFVRKIQAPPADRLPPTP